jgi:uncharacterized protein (DUF58 family)
MKLIDWVASAKLSRARGQDELVVREHYADEAPRVVVLCDRAPSMSLFPPGWPWLEKPRAVNAILRLIADSALAAQAYAGYLDHGAGSTFWCPPKSERTLYELDLERPFRAPADALERGLEDLLRHARDVPAGTFVFVVSNFVRLPPRPLWLRALARRWDLISVVVQDPVWEQSFPDVGGIVLPFADPESGKPAYAELTSSEVAERRSANEARRRELVRTLRGLDLEPVLVDGSDAKSVLSAFLAWAERRQAMRGHLW